MTFAAPSAHVERYIEEYEKKRADTVAHLKASIYDSPTLEWSKKKGVDVKVIFPESQLAS
jgi:hypothetical protein